MCLSIDIDTSHLLYIYYHHNYILFIFLLLCIDLKWTVSTQSDHIHHFITQIRFSCCLVCKGTFLFLNNWTLCISDFCHACLPVCQLCAPLHIYIHTVHTYIHVCVCTYTYSWLHIDDLLLPARWTSHPLNTLVHLLQIVDCYLFAKANSSNRNMSKYEQNAKFLVVGCNNLHYSVHLLLPSEHVKTQ